MCIFDASAARCFYLAHRAHRIQLLERKNTVMIETLSSWVFFLVFFSCFRKCGWCSPRSFYRDKNEIRLKMRFDSVKTDAIDFIGKTVSHEIKCAYLLLRNSWSLKMPKSICQANRPVRCDACLPRLQHCHTYLCLTSWRIQKGRGDGVWTHSFSVANGNCSLMPFSCL